MEQNQRSVDKTAETQENLDLKNIFCYNTDVAGATSVRRSSQAVRRGSATP